MFNTLKESSCQKNPTRRYAMSPQSQKKPPHKRLKNPVKPKPPKWIPKNPVKPVPRPKPAESREVIPILNPDL